MVKALNKALPPASARRLMSLVACKNTVVGGRRLTRPECNYTLNKVVITGCTIKIRNLAFQKSSLLASKLRIMLAYPGLCVGVEMNFAI